MADAQMFVFCPECNQKHKSGQVETLNIEEDFQGRDLLTYVCPITKQTTKATVLLSFGG